MLTLCICDDSLEDTAQIQALVEHFSGKHPEFPFRVRTFSSAFDLLDHLEKKGGFDLYLLDILMPHLKGLELGRAHSGAGRGGGNLISHLFPGIRSGRF